MYMYLYDFINHFITITPSFENTAHVTPSKAHKLELVQAREGFPKKLYENFLYGVIRGKLATLNDL